MKSKIIMNGLRLYDALLSADSALRKIEDSINVDLSNDREMINILKSQVVHLKTTGNMYSTGDIKIIMKEVKYE